MQLKMSLFVPFLRPCMHHNYGGISESHACKDCVWPIILDVELYTTCPGEQVLVVITHQVQCDIFTFETVIRKNMHLFLERCRRSTNVMVACFDAVRLFIFFLILWTLQPHFTLWLSARTLQCLLVWGCACHNAFVLYLGLTRNYRPTLQYCCTKRTNSVKYPSVNLRLGLQRRYKTFC